jgi:hypothetical protein
VTKVFWINLMVAPASVDIGLVFGALAPPARSAPRPS